MAGALFASGTVSAQAVTLPDGAYIKGMPTADNPFPHAYKAKPSEMEIAMAEMFFGGSSANGLRKAAPEPSQTVTGGRSYTFLDGPDGTIWYASGAPTFDIIEHEHYDEKLLTGFSYTIYDSNFKLIGTVQDAFEPDEKIKRVNSVEIGAEVSRSFFNSDSKYEITIYKQANPAVGFGSIITTDVYQIGGAKDEDGTDRVIQTFDGYIVDAINLPQDRFSENYYITFANMVEPDADLFDSPIDLANAYAMNLKTYKKGGWGQPQVIVEHDIRMNCWPGNVEAEVPCIFIYKGGSYVGSYSNSDVPYITYVEYEKPFFVNPLGYNPDLLRTDPDFTNIDESATPDNNLLITTYRLDTPSSSAATLVGETRVPTPQNPDANYTYYDVGSLDYLNDIDIEVPAGGGYAEIKGFVVRSFDMTKTADMQNIAYRYYDADGNMVHTIAENADNILFVDDVPNRPTQVVVIYLQDNLYYFSFVNPKTGEEQFSIPANFEGHKLMASMNRVSIGGRVLYCCQTTQQDYELDDDFNVLKKVIWLDEEGQLVRVDRLPLGEDVAMSNINIMQTALNPYLFDNDEDMEYMVLVKRYIDYNGGSTQTQEEFMLIDSKTGERMLYLTPNEEKGVLTGVSLIDGAHPRLVVGWKRGEEEIPTQDYYDLPFERFAAGEGTPENPYEIYSPAQLHLIADDLSASYVLTRDIDMSGFNTTPIENFSGTLDGRGHTISNLSISSENSMLGLFSRTAEASAGKGAVIRNLTLLNPVMNLSSTQNYAGFLVANGFHTTIQDVNVIGGTVNGAAGFDGKLGAIAGQITNLASISGCFVTGTDIVAPGATEGVGGIAGAMFTGSVVNACAFSGHVEAASYVGGIAGWVDADITISNCHVDADVKGGNTVGGVAGYSKRGLLANNFVEGTLEATTANRFNGTIALGGVLGELLGDYGQTGVTCVKGNMVAVEGFTYPEGTQETAHRIVGLTSANGIGLEPDEEPLPENGIADNYASDTMAATSADLADIATSVEGKSIDRYEADIDFYTGLGFVFGTTIEEPWTMGNAMTPRLYFESNLLITPAEILVRAGEVFTVKVNIYSRKPVTVDDIAGDLSLNFDEAVIESTGMDFVDGVLVLEFRALAEGTTNIEVATLGSTATAVVKVHEVSGITEVGADSASAIRFDGSSVMCDGTAIAIYSMTGAQVATGFGSLSTDNLPAGIYVAVAGTSKLKIAVK